MCLCTYLRVRISVRKNLCVCDLESVGRLYVGGNTCGLCNEGLCTEFSRHGCNGRFFHTPFDVACVASHYLSLLDGVLLLYGEMRVS